MKIHSKQSLKPSRWIEAQSYPDGTVIIRNADGFDLALHGDQQLGPLPAFLHFGFRLPDHNDVRTKLAQLRAEGIEITEYHDEPRYVAFKCADPDGHQVELYWKPARSLAYRRPDDPAAPEVRLSAVRSSPAACGRRRR